MNGNDNDQPEEPEVYVLACRGGCGKVYDRAEPDPFYICHRCRMMGRI